MPQAVAIANFCIDWSRGKSLPPFTPMKLQKLVFYAHGWNLGTMDQLLVSDEQVEAWNWGPVFPSLYRASKSFGTTAVAKPLLVEDWSRGPAWEGPNYQPTVEQEFAQPELIKGRIVKILDLYGKYTAAQLSNSTHEPGTPWYYVFHETYRGSPPRGTDIEPRLIASFFRTWKQNGAPPTSSAQYLGEGVAGVTPR